jgi:hypothetical protein
MSAWFKDRRVGQYAVKFRIDVYEPTSSFLRPQLYPLFAGRRFPYQATSHEGRSNREFRNFLLHVRAWLLEVPTRIKIAQELEYLSDEEGAEASIGIRCNRRGRSLNHSINSFRKNAARVGSTTDDRRLTTDV